jgi:hypothetical protein
MIVLVHCIFPDEYPYTYIMQKNCSPPKIKKMKKILIITALAFITLDSCKKEAGFLEEVRQEIRVSNSPFDPGWPQPGPDIIQRIDLTGFQVENLCTGETLTALSGDAIVNLTPEGHARLIEVHNFILQAPDGTMYRNNYIATFELIGTDFGSINTFRMISNPQYGDGTHWILQGTAKVYLKDGVPTIQVENIFMKCI